MDYKKYQKSRNMSWEILFQENVRELPVNIVELCHKLGIAVKYYDKFEQGNDGKTATDSGNALPLLTSSDTLCLAMSESMSLSTEKFHQLTTQLNRKQMYLQAGYLHLRVSYGD